MLLRKNVNNDVSKDSPKVGVFGRQIRRQRIQLSNLSISHWRDKKGYENKRSETSIDFLYICCQKVKNLPLLELRFQPLQGVRFTSFSQHTRMSEGAQTGWKLSLKATKLVEVVQLERSSQSCRVICISMAKTTQYLNKYLQIFTSSTKIIIYGFLSSKNCSTTNGHHNSVKKTRLRLSQHCLSVKNLANNTFLTGFSVGLTFSALLAGRLTACDVIWLQQCSLNSKTRKEVNTPSFNINA